MRYISLFLMLFISQAFSQSIYALTGQGFEVLSETIESSSNANGYFKPVDSSEQPKRFAFGFAKAFNSEGKAGENAVVKGFHSVALSNGTEEDQIYTYKYEVNCDGQYFRKVDRILVHPDGFAKDNGYSYLTTYHAIPGIYKINAVTQISGESGYTTADISALKITK